MRLISFYGRLQVADESSQSTAGYTPLLKPFLIFGLGQSTNGYVEQLTAALPSRQRHAFQQATSPTDSRSRPALLRLRCYSDASRQAEFSS